MSWKVLIAHAPGEEEEAEKLAQPLRQAGYEVHHQGLIQVGESLVGETTKVLGLGGPVVLCGTVRAAGSKWARRIVQAARARMDLQVVVVQMEEDADVEPLAFGERIAPFHLNPSQAVEDLLESIRLRYPLDDEPPRATLGFAAEVRFRELALKACDIIDLGNLPESDRHVATRKLELRRLYVPLRVWMGFSRPEEHRSFAMVFPEEFATEPFGTNLVSFGITSSSRYEPEFEDEYLSASDVTLHQLESIRGKPVGVHLKVLQRLVVLGDPGSGKSTLLRWLATAYLLRLKRDPELRDLPDVATLPDQDWLPVLIRCRDLDPSFLGRSLDDVLRNTLRTAEMKDEEIAMLLPWLHEKMSRGEILLLIDGLDEIIDPAARVRFSRHIERVHLAYPLLPIVVTSRIVGYREMRYRIGRGFEHVSVAELSLEDKDEFAYRWCALTEVTPERARQAAEELIRDIHSTDRIERLTGNPMLLTTLALVKRKVGKLPRRRADLYWEAVQVLLNWRSEIGEPIDFWEALPQLEYLAYTMTFRGVQQLRQDEVLLLLDNLRQEYPHLHAVHGHTSAEALRLLEQRTGILVETGEIRHLGMMIPVYEFRHLTFQEYLAARAMVDGCFPDRDRTLTLAQHVAPLAGMSQALLTVHSNMFTGRWHEPLRLCAVCCRNDDVDDVLLSILEPMPGEETAANFHSRAVLASLCLADEPNVSEEVARRVVRALVGQIEQRPAAVRRIDSSETFSVPRALMHYSHTRTAIPLEPGLAIYQQLFEHAPYRLAPEVVGAARALADSQWATLLYACALGEFRRRESTGRLGPGRLLGSLKSRSALLDEVPKLRGEENEAILAAIAIAFEATRMDVVQPSSLLESPIVPADLFRLSDSSPSAAFAAMWALERLYKRKIWQPQRSDLERLVRLIRDPAAEPGTVQFAALIVGAERFVPSIEPLLASLGTRDHDLHLVVVSALGLLGDPRSGGPLAARLVSQDRELRLTAAKSLALIADPNAAPPLIATLGSDDTELLVISASALGVLEVRAAVDPFLSILQRKPSAPLKNVVITALGMIADAHAIEPLAELLDDEERTETLFSKKTGHVERTIGELTALTLGRIAGSRAVELLTSRLGAPQRRVRAAALAGLAQTLDDEVDRKLLSANLDDDIPFLDPAAEIGEQHVHRASRRLGLSLEEVRKRFNALGRRLPLRFTWQNSEEEVHDQSLDL